MVLLAAPTSYIGALVRIPATLLPLQLPSNVLGQAAGDDPTWDPDGAFGSWLQPGPNMVGEFNEPPEELSLSLCRSNRSLFFFFKQRPVT